MIVILDCNIWISLALNRQLSFLGVLEDEGIIIAACPELFHELKGVVLRPKFHKYFTPFYIDNLFKLYETATLLFEIDKIESVVSDQKDNYLFALCKASKANYFVTGDKLLLNVVQYRQTKIISFAGLKALFP